MVNFFEPRIGRMSTNLFRRSGVSPLVVVGRKDGRDNWMTGISNVEFRMSNKEVSFKIFVFFESLCLVFRVFRGLFLFGGLAVFVFNFLSGARVRCAESERGRCFLLQRR